MTVSQKQGVFNAVVAFCEENSIQFDEGMDFQPSKEQKAGITQLVAQAMHAGEVQLSEAAAEKYDTLEKKVGYCKGLVDNWLRKDKRLNGGVQYQIKNPGSRAGAGDATVRELKKLKKTLTEQSDIDMVDAEIEKRLNEIKAEKAKSIEIDTSVLPEDLQHLVSNDQ